MIDSETGVVLDVQATPARLGAEVAAARTLVARTAARLGIRPDRVAADKAYGSAPLLAWLLQRGIEPHIPVLDRAEQTRGKLPRSAFVYDPEADVFTCPEGHRLRHRGHERRAAAHRYDARPADCAACPRKLVCTDGPSRRVVRMVDQEARDHVAALEPTPAFARSRRLRRTIERLFGHLKRNMGLRRLKLRGLAGAAEEMTMAAAAQNLLKLAAKPAPA